VFRRGNYVQTGNDEFQFDVGLDVVFRQAQHLGAVREVLDHHGDDVNAGETAAGGRSLSCARADGEDAARHRATAAALAIQLFVQRFRKCFMRFAFLIIEETLPGGLSPNCLLRA